MLLAFLGESWSLATSGGYNVAATGGLNMEELVVAHGGYCIGEERKKKPTRGFGFWVLYYY